MRRYSFLAAGKPLRNIEVENATAQIELLQKYMNAKSGFARMRLQRKFTIEVKSLLNKMAPDELLRRLNMAVQKDKFRPRDMSLYSFAMSADLEYVGGEFSTFDNILPNDLRKYMGISAKLGVFVLDSWDVARQMFPALEELDKRVDGLCLGIEKGNMDCIIFINRSVYLNMGYNAKELFSALVGTLAHEFGHFVDNFAPGKGAVGAQKINLNDMLHVNKLGEGRNDSPSEASSFVIGDMVQAAVRQMRQR